MCVWEIDCGVKVASGHLFGRAQNLVKAMISRHDVIAIWAKVKRAEKEIGKIRRELVTTDIIEQDMNEFPNIDIFV